MLTIGTLYAHGYDKAELGLLTLLGFELRPATSTYAGAQSLGFIDFSQPPALELIHVENAAEYSSFVPRGMTPYCPGISLVADAGPKRSLGDFQATFHTWDPYRIHLGYGGGNDPATPGWNYLNFGTPVVANTFIYLTEYEVPRPTPPSPPLHHNTATSITRLVFDLTLGELGALSALSSRETTEGAFQFGGIMIYGAPHVPAEVRSRRKLFPLVAVIVTVANLSGPARASSRSRPIQWLDQGAVLAEMNPLSWDLILTT